MMSDGLKLLIETTDQIEDERVITDRFAESGEVISSGLEEFAVVGDGESPLNDGAQLGVKTKSTCLLVAEELAFNGEPRDAGSDALVAAAHDEVKQIAGEGAV
jgi:hypothetical protein